MKLRILSKRDKFYPSVKYELITVESFDVDLPYNVVSHDGLIKLSGGILTVYPGYLLDGPSGPTIDTPDAIAGSVPHDALSELMRHGKIPQSARPIVDALLRDTMIKYAPKNESTIIRILRRFRDNYFYRGVRLFGRYSTEVITDGSEVITI